LNVNLKNILVNKTVEFIIALVRKKNGMQLDLLVNCNRITGLGSSKGISFV
jgi:hypothetical protein